MSQQVDANSGTAVVQVMRTLRTQLLITALLAFVANDIMLVDR